MWELKGTGDLKPSRGVAADYGSGPDAAAAALDGIRYVYADLERRAKVISSLLRDECPEDKVTPDLADVHSLARGAY